MVVIPLTTEPNQHFTSTIFVDGKNIPLGFDIKYNVSARRWYMTISSADTSETLVDSVPLITGVYPSANLLQQYEYLNIGSCCVVKMDSDIPYENPDDETLGSGFWLIWHDTL